MASIRRHIAACARAAQREALTWRAVRLKRWLLPQITQADFVEHRQHRAHEAWKHAMREAGCKLPTEMADGSSRCFCGAEIDIAGTEQHVYTAHMVARESA